MTALCKHVAKLRRKCEPTWVSKCHRFTITLS